MSAKAVEDERMLLKEMEIKARIQLKSKASFSGNQIIQQVALDQWNDFEMKFLTNNSGLRRMNEEIGILASSQPTVDQTLFLM